MNEPVDRGMEHNTRSLDARPKIFKSLQDNYNYIHLYVCTGAYEPLTQRVDLGCQGKGWGEGYVTDYGKCALIKNHDQPPLIAYTCNNVMRLPSPSTSQTPKHVCLPLHSSSELDKLLSVRHTEHSDHCSLHGGEER